ncbi:MAG: single-stranded DNA-binding protein [Sulfurovum sp.]|nr:MAG: single-stranded DNA-binding protein [Sulfurovum sp.]
MYNKIILVGNLTRDIELKNVNGLTIGSVGLATSHKYKTQSGEQKDEVMFIDVTFFGRTAEIANQYLRKGSKVLVEGRLTFQQWTAQDGSKRSKHSVTVEAMKMLDSKSDSSNNNSYSQPAQNNSYNQTPSYGASTNNQASNTQYNNIDNNDDIPF